MRLATQGQSFTGRVAKAAVTGIYNAGIGNEKKLWIDLVRRVYRVRFSMPSCNIMGVRLRWSSSHARLFAFPQVRK